MCRVRLKDLSIRFLPTSSTPAALFSACSFSAGRARRTCRVELVESELENKLASVCVCVCVSECVCMHMSICV